MLNRTICYTRSVVSKLEWRMKTPKHCLFLVWRILWILTIIQNVYNFVVASNKRWTNLLEFSQCKSKTPKGLSETRLSALKMKRWSLRKNLEGLVLTLDSYGVNINGKFLVRSENMRLLWCFNRLDCILYEILGWYIRQIWKS